MSKIHIQSKQNLFFCPGCNCAHGFNEKWTWNKDVNNPTVNPSILSIGEKRCHSFIRNGKIQFLSDCEHSLKNQTVDIPDWDEIFRG